MGTLIVSADFISDDDARLVPNLVALAVCDVKREKQAVYYTSDTNIDESIADCAYKVRTEKEILIDFWAGAGAYDVFVTYAGRSFVWPYLYNLSAKYGVQPTVQVARERYLSQQTFPYHIDLFDEFSFYRELKPWPSLQQLADFYGISYGEVGKEELAEFFLEKKFRQLATHTAQQNQVCNELYKIWCRNLATRRFINIIDD